MRNFSQSLGYLRLRAVFGALYAVFGIIIIVRSCGAFGLGTAQLPAFVLGLALIGLGSMRVRDYFVLRRSCAS